MYANIEAERARANMTRTDLAKFLGISLPTYGAYVAERRAIPSTVLITMSDKFCCSIDYLLGLTERRTPYDD